MGQKPKRARGRPPAPEAERRDVNLTLRVRAETKEALERRAIKSGRSLSAEAEFWLGQALLSEGLLDQALDLAFRRQAAGMLLLLGNVMADTAMIAGHAAGLSLEEAQNWLSNPYVYDQVAQGIMRVSEALRPEGDIVVPRVADLTRDDATWGVTVAGTWLSVTVYAMSPNPKDPGDLAIRGNLIRTRLGPETLERLTLRLEQPRDTWGVKRV